MTSKASSTLTRPHKIIMLRVGSEMMVKRERERESKRMLFSHRLTISLWSAFFICLLLSFSHQSLFSLGWWCQWAYPFEKAPRTSASLAFSSYSVSHVSSTFFSIQHTWSTALYRNINDRDNNGKMTVYCMKLYSHLQRCEQPNTIKTDFILVNITIIYENGVY